MRRTDVKMHQAPAPDRESRGWVVVAAVVVLLVAVAAVVALVRGQQPERHSDATAQPSRVSGAATPSSSPPATPVGSDVRAPVYYAGQAARGVRLYRELLSLPGVTPAQELQRAVQVAVGGTASDPDYRSLWPGGTVASITSSTADGVTVDLHGSADALTAAPSGGGSVGVQAVVYTVDAVLGQPVPVTFTIDGEAVPSVLGVDTSAPVARADPLQVQAPVWVTSPTDGASVGSTITVRGVAATFEATVVWELKQGSRVVQRGHATARECCMPSPYRFTVSGVPAGSYTLVVHDSDESGQGRPVSQDTKTVNVR
ncbi:Gmad2 immunoglobulin-like domain-containing protein [Nocardioides mangrovicus]|uniref:Gmad2 immunoglobulin-like domain-containing protein n=1 Tax=Nocardioides mangrovicus TaxID=2478913 RepID=UPI001314C5BC|nr:Gmad2 immunoglobulin-like domain-containing protein [Nocardioides mangrovicus]